MNENPELGAAIERLNRLCDSMEALVARRARRLEALDAAAHGEEENADCARSRRDAERKTVRRDGLRT